MELYHSVAELRTALALVRKAGRRIGFVPTMGALHEGHLSLVDIAKKESDCVVMSIFVNPTQFDRAGDLDSYPRTLHHDADIAKVRGVDIIFAPSPAEMYPKGYSLAGIEVDESSEFPSRILAGSSSRGYEGSFRPGHFDGVANVVGMLFNVVQPDVAVFGEKDYQQLKVIEQFVQELHFPVEIIAGALVRDQDGVALSSRNALLSDQQRERARALSRSLLQAQQSVQDGERSVAVLYESVQSELAAADVKIDYIEFVDSETLATVETIESDVQLLAAIFLEEVRLIDNVRLSCGEEKE